VQKEGKRGKRKLKWADSSKSLPMITFLSLFASFFPSKKKYKKSIPINQIENLSQNQRITSICQMVAAHKKIPSELGAPFLGSSCAWELFRLFFLLNQIRRDFMAWKENHFEGASITFTDCFCVSLHHFVSELRNN
jgi:hypothetical protein